MPYIVQNAHKTILLLFAPNLTARFVLTISTKLPTIQKFLQPHLRYLTRIFYLFYSIFYFKYNVFIFECKPDLHHFKAF